MKITLRQNGEIEYEGTPDELNNFGDIKPVAVSATGVDHSEMLLTEKYWDTAHYSTTKFEYVFVRNMHVNYIINTLRKMMKENSSVELTKDIEFNALMYWYTYKMEYDAPEGISFETACEDTLRRTIRDMHPRG